MIMDMILDCYFPIVNRFNYRMNILEQIPMEQP